MADSLEQQLQERLEQAINEPKRVDGDQGSYQNHSIQDLIELDKYIRSRNAASNPAGVLRSLMFRIKSPDGRNSS